MKQTIRKISALVLTLVMCISLLNITALAAEGSGDTQEPETSRTVDNANPDPSSTGDSDPDPDAGFPGDAEGGEDDPDKTPVTQDEVTGDDTPGDGEGDKSAEVTEDDESPEGSETKENPEPGETKDDKIGDENDGEVNTLSVDEPSPIDLPAEDETPKTLADLITEAEGGNVDLNGGVYTVSSPITIDQDITIVNGIITRDKDITIFDITGRLTLENVTMQGGESETKQVNLYGDMVEDHVISTPVIVEGSGALILNQSTITGFYARRGGGIYTNGAVLLNDGAHVDKNTAYTFDETAPAVGGGIFIGVTGSVVMNLGSSVNGNEARARESKFDVAQAGGIAIAGHIDSHKSECIPGYGGAFTMNGGEIKDNIVKGENGGSQGGGICIGSDLRSSWEGLGVPDGNKIHLNAGTISGNSAVRGGGIYIHNGVEIKLKNVYVSENDATRSGGGIWFCDHGSGQFYSDQGGYFSINRAYTEGSDFYSDAGYGKGSVHLPTRLPNGAPLNWYNDTADERYTNESLAIENINEKLDDLIRSYSIALHSEPEKTPDKGQYELIITDNHAVSEQSSSGGFNPWGGFDPWGGFEGNIAAENGVGGGIACNGNLIIGENNETALTVIKTWAQGAEPVEITVDLVNTTNGGNVVVETVKLNADNGWAHTFKDLPSDQIFTVVERAVEGYDASYSTSEDENGKVITITNAPEVKTTELTVSKTWVGDDETIRPAEVTVQLYQNGTAHGEPVTLSAADGWTYTWTELPADATYTVDEINVPENYAKEVTGSGTSYTITNTYSEPEPETTSVTVNKAWVNNDGTTTAPEGAEITVTLYANSQATEQTATLNAGNEWTASFGNLPVKDEQGADIDYTVQETAYAGYDASYVTATGENGKIVTVTNTQTPPPYNPGPQYGSLTVNKVVTGLTDETVTFTFDVTGPNGFTATLEITGSGSASLTGLTPGEYTVTEADASIEGFTWTVSGEGSVTVAANATASITVTNTYEPNTPPEEPEEPDEPDEEIPDEDTPQEEIPEIPDEEPPLAELPEEPPVEIPEEDVPLDESPKTGDENAMILWIALLMASGLGLVSLSVTGKKKTHE